MLITKTGAALENFWLDYVEIWLLPPFRSLRCCLAVAVPRCSSGGLSPAARHEELYCGRRAMASTLSGAVSLASSTHAEQGLLFWTSCFELPNEIILILFYCRRPR